MGLFGEIFSLPVKLVNVPLKIADKVTEKLDGTPMGFSEPLDDIAEEVEHLDD